MVCNLARSCRSLLILGSGTMAGIGTAALGQATAALVQKATTFEVVTIKPSDSGMQGGPWGVSQNKYRAKNTPLSRIIVQAYLGPSISQERLKGAPGWVTTDPYDTDAKADDATADSWKGMLQAQQVAIAAPLLRAMLEDRCKLVAHKVPTEVDAFALVMGKNGLRMKQAAADEPKPKRFAQFESGWMVVYPNMKEPDAKQTTTFLQMTMAELTNFLGLGAKPIVDQTELAGKWDFELPMVVDPNQPSPVEGQAPAPRPDAAHLYDWKAIGLEMKAIKMPAENLVIDHIERPTAN